MAVGLTDEQQLTGNLFYATAVARLLYWRAPRKLPAPDDIWGLAHYWKDFFNTVEGKGRVEHFVHRAGPYLRTDIGL